MGSIADQPVPNNACYEKAIRLRQVNFYEQMNKLFLSLFFSFLQKLKHYYSTFIMLECGFTDPENGMISAIKW